MNDDRGAPLLQRIDEAWGPFWVRVSALDDAMLAATPADGGWPARLILAHCARWEEWTHNAVSNRVRDGSKPDMTGAESWNDQWAAADRDGSGDEARNRLATAHQRLRTLLAGLQPAQWDDVVVRVVDFCTFRHYDEHVGSFPAAHAAT